MSRPDESDTVAFALGEPQRDYMTDPWWRVDAAGPSSRASFGLPGDFTRDGAFRRMEVLKAEHPEYTRWAVLKFTKYVHITKEDPDAAG